MQQNNYTNNMKKKLEGSSATLRSRRILGIGFAAVMALIVCISVFAHIALQRTSTALNDIVYSEQLAIEMQFHMLQTARERSILLSRFAYSRDPFDQDGYLMRFHELAEEFIEARQKLLDLEKNIDAGEQALLDQQHLQSQKTVVLQNKVIELVAAGQRENAIRLLIEGAIPAQDAVLDTLNSLMEHEILETQGHVTLLKDLHDRLNWLLVIASGTTVLLVWFIARFVGHGMNKLTTELSSAASNLEEANRRLEQQKFAMDQHDIVSISDVRGNITYVNDKFCEVSLYAREELIGQNHRILKSAMHPAEFYEAMWATIAEGRIWRGEVCNRKKDGSLYWVSTTIVPFLDADGLPYEYVSIRTQITEIKEAQQILMRGREELERLVRERTIELVEREDLLSSITNSAQHAVVMVDPEGRVAYWNTGAQKTFGYSAAEIMGGDTCALLVPKRHCKAVAAIFREFRSSGAGEFIGKTLELSAMHKNGNEFPIEISFSAVWIRQGWHAIGIARDISARKLAEQRLEQMATTDPLTGVGNRRRFYEVLHVELSRSQRYGVPLSLILFDIDHFKRINDTYGHPVGDVVLIHLANLISENIRETDVFARMGGEEFAILAANCNLDYARQFVEKLRRLVEIHPFIEAERVTCSFGVAEYHDKDDEESLIKRADEALYHAKNTGRNKVAVREVAPFE